jgi:hypothetical protein
MVNNYKSWKGFYIAVEEDFPYKLYFNSQNNDTF